MDTPINGPEELGFGYESDASASFLVVTSINGAAEYQCGMLGRNAIRCLIPPECMLKDGMTCFYYNITSKVPLSIYLRRKKFSKPEFLKFIFDIASAVNDSYGYLLNSSNFVFRQDYIYICPETLEPSLIYVPAVKGCESCEALKSFVSELLLQHIQIEGFDNGNIVQRILSAVRSESFNLKSFVTLISELLYGGNCGIAKDTAKPDTAGKQAAVSSTAGKQAAVSSDEAAATLRGNKNTGKPDTEPKAGPKARPKAGNSEAKEARPIPMFVIFAVLLQFVMALAIYLCRGLIDMAGANHTANYAAVLMIVAAVDVLIFKKLLTSGLAGLKMKNEEVREAEQKPQEETVKVKAGNMKAEIEKKEKQEAFKAVISGLEAHRPEIPEPEAIVPEAFKPETVKPEINKPDAARLSYKTELLGRHTKGVRVLKSTGKRAEEGDIVLDKDDFIIGRLEGHVDHVLYNNAVGKLHAELINRNGINCVKDLNSMNGTFINDNRIESNKEYELRVNDRLRLANSEYIFTYSG